MRGARPSVGVARFLPELDKLDQRVILEFLAAVPHLLAVVWVVLGDVPDLLTHVDAARDLRWGCVREPCVVSAIRPLTLTHHVLAWSASDDH